MLLSYIFELYLGIGGFDGLYHQASLLLVEHVWHFAILEKAVKVSQYRTALRYLTLLDDHYFWLILYRDLRDYLAHACLTGLAGWIWQVLTLVALEAREIGTQP